MAIIGTLAALPLALILERKSDNGSGSKTNGNLTDKINEIKNLTENKITLNDLLMNLARSENQKQEKLALDLLDLNMVESLTETDNVTETLEPDCFDKISVDRNQNKETTLGNNEESDMDWTTVRAKNKRNRSGSNDTE